MPQLRFCHNHGVHMCQKSSDFIHASMVCLVISLLLDWTGPCREEGSCNYFFLLPQRDYPVVDWEESQNDHYCKGIRSPIIHTCCRTTLLRVFTRAHNPKTLPVLGHFSLSTSVINGALIFIPWASNAFQINGKSHACFSPSGGITPMDIDLVQTLNHFLCLTGIMPY